jgi:hypothetical protein
MAKLGGVQFEHQFMHIGWPSWRPSHPQATVLQYCFDHVCLWRFDERHHLHLAATLRTTQGVDFVDSLNQHGPGLAATLRCGLFTGWLGRCLGGCYRSQLLPQATRLVRIPAIVPNQVRALGGGHQSEAMVVVG